MTPTPADRRELEARRNARIGQAAARLDEHPRRVDPREPAPRGATATVAITRVSLALADLGDELTLNAARGLEALGRTIADRRRG